MLQNPYNPLGIQWESNHVIQCRVSQEDFFELKRKYPYYPGLFDKVLSNLYKAVIDELRKRDREIHIETALYIDDPSYRVLDDIISEFTSLERRTVGEYSSGGDATAQHESGGLNSVHPEVQRLTEQQPDKKGRTPTRKRSAKGATKKEK